MSLADDLEAHAIYIGSIVHDAGRAIPRIASDVRSRFDSALMQSVDAYMRDKTGTPSERLSALRRHYALTAALDAAYDALSARCAASVAEDQAKVYITDQRRRARIYHRHTVPDIEVVATVTPEEMADLRSSPIEGRSIAEHVVTICDRWFDAMLSALTDAWSEEKGVAKDGFVLLHRRIDAAFKTLVQSMRKLSVAAASRAVGVSLAEFMRAFGEE